MASMMLIAVIQFGEATQRKTWNIWRSIATCFGEMALEICEVIIDFCFTRFDSGERGFNI